MQSRVNAHTSALPHDLGTVEDADAGIERTVYVAMEYIERPTCAPERHAIARGARSRPRRAALASLAAARRQGIVRRDFKPTNVNSAQPKT